MRRAEGERLAALLGEQRAAGFEAFENLVYGMGALAADLTAEQRARVRLIRLFCVAAVEGARAEVETHRDLAPEQVPIEAAIAAGYAIGNLVVQAYSEAGLRGDVPEIIAGTMTGALRDFIVMSLRASDDG